MKTLLDQLSQYAAYHRDSRNIATHLLGVPLIVVAVAILLARPSVLLAGFSLSPATVIALVAASYYLALDLRYGLAMALLLLLSVWLAHRVAQSDTSVWLAVGIGLFVLGWIVQFIGHYYEGRKPAFVDDLMGLAIGPLFVLAEIGFALRLRHAVRQQIEARVGPVRRVRKAAA